MARPAAPPGAERKIEFLCIGNALVDIFAAADEDTAARYGINKPVQHIEIEKLREILSALTGFTAVSGGGAANVAKIAGLMGARARFIGSIGTIDTTSTTGGETESDRFGRIFEKDLRDAGVRLRLPLKPKSTGICLLLQVGNETRIAASPSAALELSASDIGAEDIREAGIVVIDGFMLGRSGLVRRILDLAAECGTAAALDLSSAAIAAGYAREISSYARQYPLILFMNEAEAESFYAGLKAGGAEPAEKPERLRAFFTSFTGGSPNLVVVVKLGPRGAICFTGGNMHRAETREVTPLETTGAGDAFAAAFLAAWVRNKPLAECADLGNRVARITLDATGTRVYKEQFKELARNISRK